MKEEIKVYSIYKATNIINGKSYIGFDSNWPNRKDRHKLDSFNNESNFYFHKAIRKHGWDNFEWHLLYQSKDDQHTLNTMEKYFIEEYDSFNNGYNLTLGGGGTLGLNHSTKTREKIRLAQMGNTNSLGVKHSDKTIEKIRLAALNMSDKTREKMRLAQMGNTHWLGKKHSDKAKEKMRLAKTGKKHSIETIEKIRLAKLNISDKTRKKMSLAQMGKKHSIETIEKIRLAQMGNTNAQKKAQNDKTNNRSN